MSLAGLVRMVKTWPSYFKFQLFFLLVYNVQSHGLLTGEAQRSVTAGLEAKGLSRVMLPLLKELCEYLSYCYRGPCHGSRQVPRYKRGAAPCVAVQLCVHLRFTLHFEQDEVNGNSFLNHFWDCSLSTFSVSLKT